MKKLIIALSVVLSMSVMAQEDDKVEICASYSKLAGTIMKNRQQGVEMATMLEVSKSSALTILQKSSLSQRMQSLDSPCMIISRTR